MYSEPSLENLAKRLHADKQHRFAQTRFVDQPEQAQNITFPTPWWQGLTPLCRLTARQVMVTFVIRPVRLVGHLV